MQAFFKKAVYFAMLLGTFALVLGSTGCSGLNEGPPRPLIQRPGWIAPK